ncbi:hypothetical protein CKALI_00915 [Corynebacterium kalinowskii]|uniref:Uncharacterized protein n=1 Tax=Corynebacterium kalinowskii TaxID=2675216 RepID=A0A6B8VHK8_9CORY|nr:hypothetical protein [Corynebacterium kalinowskii]QGU01084.1 hypothetical protein CKALI_00915 [Corynebacterium kalinowskii]
MTDPRLQRPLRRASAAPGEALLVQAVNSESGAWRRLRVPGTIGMERFARILQLAFDIVEPAEHAFVQLDGTDEGAPVVMPAPTLVRFDAAGTPSETVSLGELLRVADLRFISKFTAPLCIDLSLVSELQRSPRLETLCIDGEGSLNSQVFDIKAINRELDAERWVFAKMSEVKPSLRDLIFRTGMWETAQLVAFLNIGTPPEITEAEAAKMVAPVLADARMVEMLDLDDERLGLSTSLDVWNHIAHRLPLERDTRGNDAAWLRLIALISSMPFGAATTFILEGMAWTGQRTTLAEVDSLTRQTMDVLRGLGIIVGDDLVLGGVLSKPRREFLRMVLHSS